MLCATTCYKHSIYIFIQYCLKVLSYYFFKEINTLLEKLQGKNVTFYKNLFKINAVY